MADNTLREPPSGRRGPIDQTRMGDDGTCRGGETEGVFRAPADAPPAVGFPAHGGVNVRAEPTRAGAHGVRASGLADRFGEGPRLGGAEDTRDAGEGGNHHPAGEGREPGAWRAQGTRENRGRRAG